MIEFNVRGRVQEYPFLVDQFLSEHYLVSNLQYWEERISRYDSLPVETSTSGLKGESQKFCNVLAEMFAVSIQVLKEDDDD